jgi:hypothetical protein
VDATTPSATARAASSSVVAFRSQFAIPRMVRDAGDPGPLHSITFADVSPTSLRAASTAALSRAVNTVAVEATCAGSLTATLCPLWDVSASDRGALPRCR